MKIPLNAENREMMALAPNYDSLTAMQKVEIFTEALERTKGKGNDLYEVLWIKSTNRYVCQYAIFESSPMTSLTLL